MRHNRRVLEQEAQLNAPDPRETHPPCYEDAIQMPRLDSSFASLKHLDGDSDSDDRRKAAKRSRSLVEISARPESEDGVSRPKRHILAARIRRGQPVKPSDLTDLPMRSPTTTSPLLRSSTEIITLKCSPRMNRANKVDMASRASSTSEFAIEPVERYVNFAGRSPYAQRRVPNSPGGSHSQPSSSMRPNASSLIDIDGASDIVVIENHYASIRSLFDDKDSIGKGTLSESSWTTDSDSESKDGEEKRHSVVSNSSLEYTSFTKDEIQNVRRSQI